MSDEEIKRLLSYYSLDFLLDEQSDAENILKYTATIRAAEREACAKVCDNYDIRAKTSDGWIILNEAQRVSSELAAKIRARGEV